MGTAGKIAKTALYVLIGAVGIAALTLIALAIFTRFAPPPGRVSGDPSPDSPPYTAQEPAQPGDTDSPHDSGQSSESPSQGGANGQGSPSDPPSADVGDNDNDDDNDNGNDGNDDKSGGTVDDDNSDSGAGSENSGSETGPGAAQPSPDINLPPPAGAIAPDSGIQSAIDSIAQKYGAVGVQVAVLKNGKIAGTYEYGYAAKGIPMTVNTKIRIASISKVILTMAIMRLVEQGQLDLDSDISEYWGFSVRNPNHRDIPITIRQILSHISSIRNYDYGFSAGGDMIRSRFQDGSGFGSGTPGSLNSFIYNNYAFATLGVMVEIAADETVNSLAGRYLFAPLGIDAAFGSGSITDTDSIATLYTSGGGVGRSQDAQKRALGNSYPGERGEEFPGGLTISAFDLSKLIAVLVNDGEYEGKRILSKESVAVMESSQGMVEGFSQCLPMRLRRNVFGQEELYYHTGSNYGVYTLFSYNPKTGDAVIVLTSGASDSRDANFIPVICAEISDYIYKNM